MKVYEYPKCSTCKEAKKFLTTNSIEADFIDITKTTPNKEDILKITSEFSIDIKKLFNTSGIKYRELGLKDKLDSLTLDEKIDILLSDGMLIKRPLAYDFDKKIFLQGFKENTWKDVLK